MDKKQIIRAWKDEDYRQSLGESERQLLPDHPSGLIDLADESLGQAGAATTIEVVSVITATIGAVTAITAAFSCAPVCNETLGGTCRNFTSGCCT